MDTDFNYKCDYLDLDSYGCKFLDEMNQMPNLDEDCQCLECLVALYKFKGGSTAGPED